MIIRINDFQSLEELQDRFEECFPLLKLEFYSRPHNWQEASRQEHRLEENRKVGEVRKIHNQGILEIKSWYQTGRVEQDFRKIFGLNVQILRRQQGQWVQTTGSDKLTLRQQHELARSGDLLELRSVESH